MRDWTARRWGASLLAILGAGLLLGLPTDLIPNPVFGRQIEVPGWAYPAWIITSILAGLLLATYVRDRAPSRVTASVTSGEATSGEAGESTSAVADEEPDQPFGADEKRFTAGGLLAVFAIGCPTCNALVMLALGTNGALAFFEPVQPFLAIAGIALLAWALRRRLQSERTCAVPPR
ncbi:MAG: hypothetical protein WDZ26_06105 [Nitriliruptoraceae bacterium]